MEHANSTWAALSTAKLIDASVCGPGSLDMGWSCTAPNTIILFTAFCLLSVLARKIAARSCPATSEGSVRQQRNVATYIVGLLVKTVSFVTTFAAGAPLIFMDEPLSDESMRICLAAGLLSISTFYAWEMAYRIDMDIMLIIHHVSTLILVVVCALGSFAMQQEEIDLPYHEGKRQAMEIGRRLVLRITLIELLAAATNQPVLVALLLHRAKASASHRAFYVSAAWEAVSKTLRFVIVLLLYGSGAYVSIIGDHCDDIQWCWALRILYPLLATMIWVSNMHMVRLLWSLANRRTLHTPEKAEAGPGWPALEGLREPGEAKRPQHVGAHDCAMPDAEAVPDGTASYCKAAGA